MAITAAAAFNLVLINDQTHSPTFLNKNNIGDHQLLVDSAIFAQPPTSLFTSQTQPRRCQISCKKTKWFKKFVDALECLSIEEINDPARQWHCSACGRGGTIQRYLGVQTLMQHAKGAGSTRVRLHRELAQLLEQRLHNHNDDQHPTSAKWIALKQEKKDHNIVWPPMVLITNTFHKKDPNNKWIGMKTEELVKLFSSYEAIVEAKHGYNSKGHCGTSILIFETSAEGYLEAERLHRHFEEQQTDRNAWNSDQPVCFLTGTGERQLYGYMALKEDLDSFNENSSKGKKVKYEMRSYKEMVVNGIKKMRHGILWLKRRVAEQQREAKDVEGKLQRAIKEMDILRRKAKEQHQQSIEELGFQENFYKDQIRNILQPTPPKDANLENAEQDYLELSVQTV